MKKLLILAVGLLIGWTVSAQPGLNGTWYYEETKSKSMEDAEGGGTVTMAVTYQFADDTFSMTMAARLKMDLKSKDANGAPTDAAFLIAFSGSVDGTLVRQGSLLTLTPAKGKTPQVDVDFDAQGVPGGGLMKSMVAGPVKKQLNAELKEVRRYRILSLSETELTLEEVLAEKEIKKGEKPEKMVFKHKSPMP